jgi:hypothetical protein
LSKRPEIFSLSKDLLLAPRQAVSTLAEGPRVLPAALTIYATYLVTAVIFYNWKPADFPPPPGGPGAEIVSGGLFFWLKVFSWNPPFLLIGTLFVAAFAWGLKEGKLALRLPLALMATALPAAWLAAANSLPRTLWIVGWMLLIGVAGTYARRLGKATAIGLLALMTSVNIVALAFLPLFTVAVLTRMPRLYLGCEILMVVWTLGLASFAIARLLDMRVARAFTTLILSTIVQVLFIFAMRVAGWIPADALKALMTA